MGEKEEAANVLSKLFTNAFYDLKVLTKTWPCKQNYNLTNCSVKNIAPNWLV